MKPQLTSELNKLGRITKGTVQIAQVQ
jgi:hypothetical protein